MKRLTKIMAFVLLAATVSSCATVFGGPVTQYQKTKPAAGEPQRKIRVVPLVANILMFPPGAIGMAIDFATGAIYKPQPTASQASSAQPAGK